MYSILRSQIELKSSGNVKKLFFILLLQLPLSLVSGQDEICNIIVDQRSLFEAPLTGQPYKMNGTIGSQLFMDGSFRGIIILYSEDTVRNKSIAYNEYEDELIWSISGNNSMIKVDKEQVAEFIFLDTSEGKNIAFRHLHGTTTGNRQIDLFAQKLLDDTVSLYVTHLKQIVGKDEHEVGGFVTYMDKIEPKPKLYYLGFPGNYFLSINKPRIRALYNTLPDKKAEIRALLIKHHETVRNERDLIRVIKLLNENKIIK